jgi:hypothetical protein
MLIVNVPSEMTELAASYDDYVNKDTLVLTHIITKGEQLLEIEKKSCKLH